MIDTPNVMMNISNGFCIAHRIDTYSTGHSQPHWWHRCTDIGSLQTNGGGGIYVVNVHHFGDRTLDSADDHKSTENIVHSA